MMAECGRMKGPVGQRESHVQALEEYLKTMFECGGTKKRVRMGGRGASVKLIYSTRVECSINDLIKSSFSTILIRNLETKIILFSLIGLRRPSSIPFSHQS